MDESAIEKKLTNIKNHLNDLENRILIFKLAEGSIQEELLEQNILHLCTRVLNYSINLNRGAFELLKSNNVFPSFFLIRANLEAVGVLANLFMNMEKYYKSELLFKEMDKLVLRYSLGSDYIKVEGREIPEKINIMSGIDVLDKWYSRETKEKSKIFRKTYDYLSQFCHPNFHGLAIVSSLNKGFVEPRNISQISLEHFDEVYNDLKISNITFLHFYDAIIELLKNNEK